MSQATHLLSCQPGKERHQYVGYEKPSDEDYKVEHFTQQRDNWLDVRVILKKLLSTRIITRFARRFFFPKGMEFLIIVAINVVTETIVVIGVKWLKHISFSSTHFQHGSSQNK